MDNQENLLAQVDVGSPPSEFPRWESVDVCFHDFVNLATERGEIICSPGFACLGHLWTVVIYPGGGDESSEGMVAIYLYHMSEQPIDVDVVISIRDLDGKEAACPVVFRRLTFGSAIEGDGDSWGEENAVKRTHILSNLVYGSLVLGVRMKKPGPMNGPMSYVPSNPLCKNILKMFMDEDTADVVFEVVSSVDQDGENAHKKTKNVTAFPAHRFIVRDGAPLLAELCKAATGDHATVQITDVLPHIFHHMLYYVYGGVIPRGDLHANAKDLIDASDKYGIVILKLETEAAYVESMKLTVDNVLDNLLYADSKNLAVLKEAVMDYMVKNEDDIIGKISFDNVPGSIVTDLLAAISRGKKNGDEFDDYNSTNYNKMGVGTLRMLLDNKGFDVDGSREAMIALLKQNREEEQA